MFPASLTRVHLEEKRKAIHHSKYQILLMLLLMHQWLVCKRWSLFFFGLFFTEPVNQEGVNQRRGRQYWQYVDESTMQHSWETCRAFSQKNGNQPTITSAVAFMIALLSLRMQFRWIQNIQVRSLKGKSIGNGRRSNKLRESGHNEKDESPSSPQNAGMSKHKILKLLEII